MLGNEKKYIIQIQDALELDSTLVGEKGLVFSELLDEDIPTSHGFVITSETFNDFLTANDLVQKINEKLASIGSTEIKAIEKVSGEIEELFKKTTFSESFENELQSFYSALTGGHSKVIRISPSWPSTLHKISEGIDSRYTFTNITSYDDLKRGIVLSWQAIFDPEIIKRRIESSYTGPLSMALLVQRMVNSEVSGRAYTYNPLNGNRNEIEIEAVLGIWRGVDELGITPDRYVVEIGSDRIIEKNTTSQPKMLLRKPVFKQGEDIDFAVNVSKPWQAVQKATDQNILDVFSLVTSIKGLLGSGEYEIEWGVDMGKVHVVGIRSIMPPSTPLMKKTETSKGKLNEVEIVKSIDNYVEEIETEIENLSKVSNALEEQKVEKVPEVSEIFSSKVWSKIKFTSDSQKSETLNNVWIRIDSFPNYSVSSNLFDGLSFLPGEDLVRGFGAKFSSNNKDQFNNYGVQSLYEVASQDLNKEVLYSPSILSLDESETILGNRKEGIGSHMENDELFLEELRILKNVRDRNGCRKLSVILREIGSLENLAWVKKMISTVGLRRTSTFKVFLLADTLPLYLDLKGYLTDGVDGIIIDFDKIWSSMYGKKASEKLILEEKLFWNPLNEILKLAHQQRTRVFAMGDSIALSYELIKKLIRSGITGFVFGWPVLEKGRKNVSQLELSVLD